MQQPRRLQNSGVDTGKAQMMGQLVSELLHSATQTHILHLRTTSFAAHMALGAYYDGIVGLADGVAEGYQGVTGSLLSYPSTSFQPLQSVEDAIPYLKGLHDKVTTVQEACEYSEIGNDLDTIKSLIDSTLYKLKFLK